MLGSSIVPDYLLFNVFFFFFLLVLRWIFANNFTFKQQTEMVDVAA